MRKAPHAAVRLLELMMVASLVLPALLFAFASTISYRNAHVVADERIDRSLDILHEHALKVFQTIERSISEVDEVVRGMSDEEIAAQGPQLSARLRKISNALPQVQGIAVINRDGRPVLTSNAITVPSQFDLSDRDYFQAHRDQDAGTYVSQVTAPRMGGLGTYFFAVARRRHSPEGAHNGIINIAVLPSYFESFYAKLDRSGGNYYAMARADGGFLARYPVPTGNRLMKLDERSGLRVGIAKGLERDIYTVESQLDSVDRRIGYRKLSDFPVYVLAGTELSAIKAEWLSLMGSYLIFGLPATAALFLVLGLALRRTKNLYQEAERREAAEGALRQAQRLEAIGQLTGGVAHDFNNLLMIVSGSVQRLRGDLKDKKHVRLLDMITTASQRGESLTRQLLTYSRQQTLSPEVIDLSQRLPALKDVLMRSLRGDIDITVDAPPEICAVRVDPGEFELAILNLAVNAQDAMPNGGTLSIRVKAVTLKGEAVSDGLRGEFVAIRLSDTGVGIPVEILPKVFEPFFTTKDIGKGTGLGLSQVYGFAKQSGGTATISSGEGRGTTITLYLPRSQERPDAASEVKAATHTKASGTILVVEDNPDVAEVGASFLQQLGYRVRSVDNARAALAALRSDRDIDLVFSDILMPGGMNGLDLARQIREQFPETPVLLTTGYSGSAQDAVRQGVVVLQKPYDIDSLEKNIREAMQSKSARTMRATQH